MLAERERQQTEAPGTEGPATDDGIAALFDAADAEARLGLPFEKAAELQEKRAKAEELKAALKVEDEQAPVSEDETAEAAPQYSYMGWHAVKAGFSALVKAREAGLPRDTEARPCRAFSF